MANEAMLTQMKADTVAILSDWAEALEIHRATQTYNDRGQASRTWTQVGSFVGDWQAASGDTARLEAALSINIDAVAFGPFGIDVEENDRIQKTADASFMYVTYVRHQEDHTEIFLRRTTDSE
jgi:hypothetical protein